MNNQACDDHFKKWLLERCDRIGYEQIPGHLTPAYKKGDPRLLPVAIIHEWHDYLRKTRESDEEDAKRRELIRSLDIEETQCSHLAALIIDNALEAQFGQHCYLYLKTWKLGEGNCWFKVGITNDLRRRDREQNVLPVPPTTLLAIKVINEQSARAIEKSIHDTLRESKVLGAQNRELFELNTTALSGLIVAMKALGDVVEMSALC
jgi:hypothetical protein